MAEVELGPGPEPEGPDTGVMVGWGVISPGSRAGDSEVGFVCGSGGLGAVGVRTRAEGVASASSRVGWEAAFVVSTGADDSACWSASGEVGGWGCCG